MQRKILKKQAVVFGSFNFPAAPDTTLKLLNIFASSGFLPQMVNVADPVSGLNSQKIALMRGSDFQIHFGSDRIDVLSLVPQDEDLSGFVAEAAGLLSRLEGGALNFSRIALIIDYAMQGLTPDQSSQLCTRLLPGSGDNPVEWAARWVNSRLSNGEAYNVCFEAVFSPGMFMVVNNRMEAVPGVKIMHDISTSPGNIATRFNAGNLKSSFDAMIGIIDSERALIKFA